jgi:hypothetical protein
MLARGSFSVVTVPSGSSRMRDSMLEEGSETAKLGGRTRCLADEALEKKRGDWAAPSDRERLVDVGFAVEGADMSRRLGGEEPVRAFLTGVMLTERSRLVCREGPPRAWRG